MKKFKLIVDSKKYEGTFDTNSTTEENIYVLYIHNGLIGVRNPTGIDNQIVKKLLFDNKEKVNYLIEENDFSLFIGEEE